MALIVEDGTGMPNAESYVSVATADAYHAAMGNTEWAEAETTAKEVALRRGTQYIDTRYAFVSEPRNATQALAWPRVGYPWPVKAITSATCELALRGLSSALYVDAGDAPVTRETVGPITVEYGASINDGQTRYSVVDDLLRSLLVAGGSRLSLRLERAE